MPSIARELIEVGHEWVCSQCSYEFYNPGCILDGLTLNEIIQHVKKMREQAFAKHKCSTTAPGLIDLQPAWDVDIRKKLIFGCR